MIDEREFQRWFKQAEHNAIGLGSPFESFDEDDFKVALRCCESILFFIESEFRNAKGN